MRLALSAWAGMGNIGDDWLLQATLRLAGKRTAMVILEPGASVPDFLPESMHVQRWPSIREASDWKGLYRFRKELEDRSDGVVHCGGGWLAGDQGTRTPARWAFRGSLLPYKSAGFGLGLGPFVGGMQQHLARIAASGMAALAVRAPEDAHWARLALRRNVSVIGDPTFALGSRDPIPVGEGSGVAVIMPAPFSHWMPAAMAHQYADAVIELAATLATGERVSFFAFDKNHDAAFWSSRSTVTSPTSVEDFLVDIADYRLVIAGRFHAGVAAVLAGKPVVSFSYHHKFDALRSIGVESHPIRDLIGSRSDYVPSRGHLAEETVASVRLAFEGLVASIGGGVDERRHSL